MASKTMTEQVEDDIRDERVRQLESAVLTLSADIQNISQAVRDVQGMIVKIATNQQQLAERVSMWPYIKLDTKKKRSPPDKGIDSSE
jgi:hypothetical protein